MTPDERAFLQVTGSLLSDRLLYISITVLFSGIFIGLWILAYHSLLKRGLGNSKARWAQLAALLVAFVSSIGPPLSLAAEFTITAAHLNAQVAAINAETSPFEITSIWAQQIGLLINDSVVIWRAWVLYRDKRIVLFSLCLTFCATLATSFGGLALITEITVTEISAVSAADGPSSGTSNANTLSIISTALSLTTNIFATTLIFIQLWRHRRFIDPSGLHRHSLTSSQRILLFLIEAGFIFCTGQVADFCTTLYFNTNHSSTFVAYFILATVDAIFWSSLPLYLPIIILLVENNRTITETFSFNSGILEEVLAVEAGSHQDGGPEPSPTIGDGFGTAQVSAHNGSDHQ